MIDSINNYETDQLSVVSKNNSMRKRSKTVNWINKNINVERNRESMDTLLI